MKIVQIVPRSDPATGGVSSYADALGRELAAHQGIESDVVAVDDSLGGRDLDAPTCLLHYVNYAYHPRGCPVGLVRDLRRWRQPGNRRLVTFFHEVYATGPVWRSSFWLAPVQRRLARDLARASDRLATSLALYRRMLEGFRPQGPIVVTPVFSTVGEPALVPALVGREPRMLVFGGPGARSRAYGPGREALAAACRALRIEEIVDLGPPLGTAALPKDIDGIPVHTLGALSAAEASAWMLAARAGFLTYPADFLPKSSIFAAYSAHGLLPVRVGAPDRERRVPYWAPRTETPPEPAELQAIADAARSWYLEHSIARQAAVFRDLLVPEGSRS